jgi:hypothetical protein
LRWEQRTSGRWIGVDADGAEVGFVGLTVTAGGERRYHFAWRRDGSPSGDVVGDFDSAEQAMAAVDEREPGDVQRTRGHDGG